MDKYYGVGWGFNGQQFAGQFCYHSLFRSHSTKIMIHIRSNLVTSSRKCWLDNLVNTDRHFSKSDYIFNFQNIAGDLQKG